MSLLERVHPDPSRSDDFLCGLRDFSAASAVKSFRREGRKGMGFRAIKNFISRSAV